MSYNESEAIEQKVRSMRVMVSDYNGKQAIVRSAPAHPIRETELDGLQTKILLKLEAHKLNLSKLSAATTEQKVNDRVFEMEVRGEYENLMAFLYYGLLRAKRVRVRYIHETRGASHRRGFSGKGRAHIGVVVFDGAGKGRTQDEPEV